MAVHKLHSNDSPEALDIDVPQGPDLTDLGPYGSGVNYIDVRGKDRLSVEIAVTEQALDGFAIQFKTHHNGSWLTLFNTATQFQNPDGPLLAVGRTDDPANNDLTTIPAGESGWFLLDVSSISRVKFQGASAHVDGSVVSIFAGVSN